MNRQIIKTLSTMMTATSNNAQEHTTMSNKASYIEMNSAKQQTQNLATFLKDAATIVKQTEPGTELWFALQNDATLAIFDIFANKEAQEAHFTGEVADALQTNSEQLIEGGWEKGVVSNIKNSTVLSSKAPTELYTATTATYIELKAIQGKGNDLADLLTAAGQIVTKTEPKTLYWVALRLDENNFAIFDVFADNSGREAHFAGKVANLLKEKSSALVEKGWNEGVVANVNNYEILAIK